MFRLVRSVLYFIMELIFDSKEEYSLGSNSFSIKKVLQFILIITLFISNGAYIYRSYVLWLENVELKKQIQLLSEKNPPVRPSDSSKHTVSLTNK